MGQKYRLLMVFVPFNISNMDGKTLLLQGFGPFFHWDIILSWKLVWQMLCSEQGEEGLSVPWWRYACWAIADVEANYMATGLIGLSGWQRPLQQTPTLCQTGFVTLDFDRSGSWHIWLKSFATTSRIYGPNSKQDIPRPSLTYQPAYLIIFGYIAYICFFRSFWHTATPLWPRWCS